MQEGMRARVTWFNDPWYNDETRILRFEVAQQSATRPAQHSMPADFNTFWLSFSRAAANGNVGGVKALTRFPFSILRVAAGFGAI